MSLVATATSAAMSMGATMTASSKPKIVPFSGSKFPPREIQTLYLVMQMVALVCVTGLALTIWLAPSVKRHPFIYTYLALSGLTSIAATISLIPAAGYMLKVPTYPFRLVQASFGFSGGVTAAYSDLMLATLMCFKIAHPGSKIHQFRFFDTFIIGSTWLVYVVISIVCLAAIHRDHGIVAHLGIQCVLALPSSMDLYHYTTVVLNGATIVFDIIMTSLLISHRVKRPTFSTTTRAEITTVQSHSFNAFPSSPPPAHLFFPPPPVETRPPVHARSRSESKGYIKQRSSGDWGLAVRVSCLGAFFLINMVLNILLISKRMYAGPAVLYYANRGTIITLIFASQTDILNVYISALNCFLIETRDAYYHCLASIRGKSFSRSPSLSSDEARFRTNTNTSTSKTLTTSAISAPGRRDKAVGSNQSFSTHSGSSTELGSADYNDYGNGINVLTFSQKPAHFGNEKEEERSFSEYSPKKAMEEIPVEERRGATDMAVGGRGVIMVTVETEVVEEVDLEAQKEEAEVLGGFAY